MISTLALTFPVVSSLEAGLRADCGRLIKFEAELTHVLEQSHELANVYGSPADWNLGCRHHWGHVKAILRRIHRLLAEMNDAVGHSHPQAAWKHWEEVQRQEDRLALALSGLRDQTAHLNEAAADDWKRLIHTIESHRRAVQTGIQRLHLRLQSWACPPPQHAITEAMAIAVLDAAVAPPSLQDLEETEHLRELDQAALEIEAEQHQDLGLVDGLKALFLWVEAPGERVRVKHDNTV